MKRCVFFVGSIAVASLWGCSAPVEPPTPGALPPRASSELPARPSAGTPIAPPVTPPVEPPAGCEEAAVAPMPLQLLTRTELDLTLQDLLGIESSPARALLPIENTVLGFDNNAEAHQVSPLYLESLLTLVEQVSAQVLEDTPAALHACVPGALVQPFDDPAVRACRDAVIADFAFRAYRRPLTGEEQAVLRETFDAMAADVGEGFVALMQATLLSPQFLYHVRRVAPDEALGSEVELDDYEVAERLSYLFWRSMPDAALFAAAEAGALHDPVRLAAQIDRMLADPRAVQMTHDFHRQWLALDKLDTLRRDLPADHPFAMDAVAEGFRESLLRFTASSVLEGGGVDALLSSPTVFLDDAIAELYGHLATTAPIEFPVEERAGLITQPGLMALLAHADQTSPIHRGIFVRERLLCEHLPPPPPDLVITPPSPDPNATTRERFAAHTEEESCQGCHVLIDPIGFGFEGYDALGRFRTTENGFPIDDSGSLLYTASRDPALEGNFFGAVELAHRLADAPQVRDCIATQWWRFAHGRGEQSEADRCMLDAAQADLRGSGQFTTMLQNMASSLSFRTRPAELLPAYAPPPEPMGGVVPSVDAGPAPEADAGLPDSSMGDPTPQSPIGWLDSVDVNGVVRGWALDPNTPLYPLEIHAYIDGPAGMGTHLQPSPRADLPRADVNAVTGYGGDHGFAFELPASLRDGNVHTLYIYPIDTGSSPNPLLGGSPKEVRINDLEPAPRGHVDRVTAAGIVQGWSFDPSAAGAPVRVDFYLDEPWYRGGMLLGSVTTSFDRPDVDAAFGVDAQAGFSFSLPAFVRDNTVHTLHAVAFDTTHPEVRVSIGQPIDFQVAP